VDEDSVVLRNDAVSLNNWFQIIRKKIVHPIQLYRRLQKLSRTFIPLKVKTVFNPGKPGADCPLTGLKELSEFPVSEFWLAHSL
jgi:hypothetical protein